MSAPRLRAGLGIRVWGMPEGDVPGGIESKTNKCMASLIPTSGYDD